MIATNSNPKMALHADDEYSVQQVAAITGMSEHNLRYYERAGLLSPVRRDRSSGHRRYTRADITRIENLACLRATGMPLEQMRRYIEGHEAVGEQVARGQVELFEAHRQVLEERLRQTQRNLEYVEIKAAYWRAVEAHDDLEVECLARQIRGYIQEEAPKNRGKKTP